MSEKTTPPVDPNYATTKPIEVVESGFCKGMRFAIFQGKDNEGNDKPDEFFVVADMNRFSKKTSEFVPIRYWNYDSLLVLQRLIDKTLERLSWWYFSNEK